MNKMAKGAIATAAGVVLLIGGGGTLAVWNVEKNSQAGTIQAGNLDLTTANGQWLANGKPVANISAYRIVPGDVLEYTEEVTITVDGDNLTAKLALSGLNGTTDFVDNTYETVGVQLEDLDGNAIPEGIIADDVVDGPRIVKGKASVDFTFKVGTANQDSATKTYSFADAQFALTQVTDQ